MIMTEGGPAGSTTVLVQKIYNHAFRYFEMGYASAVSWVLFLIIFIVTLVQNRLQKRWVDYEQ
jgi:multiple sugar transport system permease protein